MLAGLRSVTITLVLVALSPGCEKSGDTPVPAPVEEKAIIQEKGRGPVTVSLRVEPKEPTFAERIHYSVTARAEKGVEVRLPSPGENLGGFIIRDFLAFPEKSLGEKGTEIAQSYVLEVLTSGEFVIPETTVSFVDRRSDDGRSDGEAGETSEERVFKILTDPITIEVKSIDGTDALEDLRPIVGPMDPARVPPGLKWPLIGVGTVLGLAILIFVAIKFRRQRLGAPPPVVPPEELAYRELEWLLRQDFPGRAELKEFFFHVSRIVREYIERRFGLRAPEQTTEEFLNDLSRSEALGPEHQALLRRFLEKADMVKFARYAPAAEEIEESFEAAKEFISQTRAKPEEVTSGSR